METTTRLGSRVVIDESTKDVLYGRWFDGVNTWYSCKWNSDGKIHEGDYRCSLDLVWPPAL